MDSQTIQRKATWWEATKVAWAFTWRYLAIAALPGILVAMVVGFVVGIGGSLAGIAHMPFFGALSAILGMAIGFGAVINMFRMMLNKRDFKGFMFQLKD